jgi:putative N6-adenine-specific DNA methylase
MASATEFFATCAPGLEPVLHQELKELQMANIERQVGGCRFAGTRLDAARANLWLRSANRVLLRVARYECVTDTDLYEGALEVPWEKWLKPDGTLRVKARARDSNLTHARFVEQRVKDAICDRFRRDLGTRPNVGDRDVDLGISVHLYRDRVILSLDTSGEPLYKRGWREAQGRAPLPETLAAGVLLLSGWNRRAPLLDPFCGSGTLLVEAALMAADIAPGSFRSFGMERWKDAQAVMFERLRADAQKRRRSTRKLQLVGSDIDSERVQDTAANLAAAGIDANLQLEVKDARLFSPKAGWNGQVATNAPWGSRVGAGDAERLFGLYRAFGTQLRQKCEGYGLALLAGNEQQLESLAMPGDQQELANGNQPCVLLLNKLLGSAQ